jgi:hypothetical protein
MRRTLVIAPVLALLAAGAAGCSLDSTSTTVPATVKAPPQTAHLDWREPYPPDASTGWNAEIWVENRSKVEWEVGDAHSTTGLTFGVMLFPNDDAGELEDRISRNDLPAIRHATTYTPNLPSVLGSGETWRGLISAPGPLAGGLWVRVTFGPFTSVGGPPDGAAARVVWITDHAHRLEEVAAEPA